MSDKVRVLRVIEYSGSREAVEALISRSVNGEKFMRNYSGLGEVTIKVATVGNFP